MILELAPARLTRSPSISPSQPRCAARAPAPRGRPWGLPLEDPVLLVVAYRRTNLTVRQLAPLIAFQPRLRFAKDTVLIVDGTLVPTRDHSIAEQSKNYRYSTNHQVVIDADTRPIVVVGEPLPGNRNDCRAWEESGAKAAVGRTLTMADGGYPGTGLLMPHRRTPGEGLPDWKREHNRSHKQVRAVWCRCSYSLGLRWSLAECRRRVL